MTELAQTQTTDISGDDINPFLSKTREGFSVTIDAANLTAADVGGSFPGVLRKGFPLGVAADGVTYEKKDDADLEGLLSESLRVKSATSVVHAALCLEAVVDESLLPVAITQPGKDAVAGRITFR
ncbi:MAG: hypothetical protein AAF567_24465 [Actinomycetota bacterium]